MGLFRGRRVKNHELNSRAGAFSGGRRGVEVEVARFVGDTVRLVRPELVVVSGVEMGGLVALEVDLALSEGASAGFGGSQVVFEPDEGRAAGFVGKLGVHSEVVAGKLADYAFRERVGVAFLAGKHAERVLEVEALSSVMMPRGLLFVGGTGMMSVGGHGGAVRLLRGKFNTIEFPTARGLMLLQPRGGLWSRKLEL